MKSYIAYFDFLGFKNFILNNDNEHIRKRIGHILRDIEAALGQGEYKEARLGFIADISKSKLNCLNISDTIILWANDDSFDSFLELLKVSFDFNWRVTRYHFPVRGAIVYDDLDIITHNMDTKNGGTYNVNSIFGKGLVSAHIKAENLNLAGCIVDSSTISKIEEFANWEKTLDQFATIYSVPYKEPIGVCKEYILRLFVNKTINPETFDNVERSLSEAFSGDNKEMNDRSLELLKNTVDYIRSFVK